MLRINKFVSSVAGIGYLPLAPGTFAAAFAGILWILISNKFQYANNWQLPVVLGITLLGVYTSGKISQAGEKDPSYVVIDELAGMWISVLFIPPTIINILLAFALFRFFDIAKPLGIKRMEKRKNGWGVMLDDVLAGIYSNIALRLMIMLIPFL
jgi:phosphatidylglycerophosphatase A